MITAARKKQKTSADEKTKKAFDDFIIENGHPCVMAQTMFREDKGDMHVYDNFGSERTASKILDDLRNYVDNYDFSSNDFYTYIAVFNHEQEMDEQQFEHLLWKQLQHLHEADDRPWDKSVSTDPENENFSFSLLDQAFYIIGLHPGSSRKARQAPYPAMVFNLHWQFEQLRKMGVYKQVRDTIRERDIEFEGSINPMLDDFGDRSEARQYSGRQVGDDWKCPFHHK